VNGVNSSVNELISQVNGVISRENKIFSQENKANSQVNAETPPSILRKRDSSACLKDGDEYEREREQKPCQVHRRSRRIRQQFTTNLLHDDF
jgi:hypothetical protein